MATTYGYKKLYELFRDASKELTYPVGFDGGLVADINIFNKEHNKVLLWLTPATKTAEFINRRILNQNWAFLYYVYKQDSQDSDNDVRNEILNDCDFVATEYFILINQYFEENESREFNISTLSAVPIIRATTEIFTGLECKFTITLQDDNPYCDNH